MHATDTLDLHQVVCVCVNCDCYPRGMLVRHGIWGDTSHGGEDNAMQKAFEDFTTWRKMMKIPCSQKRWSWKSIRKETTYGFYLNAKGYNARVIVEYLLYTMIWINLSPQHQHLDPRFPVLESTLSLNCDIMEQKQSTNHSQCCML